MCSELTVLVRVDVSKKDDVFMATLWTSSQKQGVEMNKLVIKGGRELIDYLNKNDIYVPVSYAVPGIVHDMDLDAKFIVYEQSDSLSSNLFDMLGYFTGSEGLWDAIEHKITDSFIYNDALEDVSNVLLDLNHDTLEKASGKALKLVYNMGSWQTMYCLVLSNDDFFQFDDLRDTDPFFWKPVAELIQKNCHPEDRMVFDDMFRFEGTCSSLKRLTDALIKNGASSFGRDFSYDDAGRIFLNVLSLINEGDANMYRCQDDEEYDDEDAVDKENEVCRVIVEDESIDETVEMLDGSFIENDMDGDGRLMVFGRDDLDRVTTLLDRHGIEWDLV